MLLNGGSRACDKPHDGVAVDAVLVRVGVGVRSVDSLRAYGICHYSLSKCVID
jgi:hypothetical protein